MCSNIVNSKSPCFWRLSGHALLSRRLRDLLFQCWDEDNEAKMWFARFVNKKLHNISFNQFQLFSFLVIFILWTISTHNTSSLDVNCDFSLIRILKVKETYKCIVRDFILVNKTDKFTSVVGAHKSNKTAADVSVLTLENQICHYLPPEFAVHFPNLFHLDVKNSSLLAVDQSTMKLFVKLKIIYLRGNWIEAIPANLFKFNRFLEFINFDDNRIRRIDVSAFANLPNIVSISLERNICIDNFAMDAIGRNNLTKEIQLKCA